jgi:hypothetical protein
MAAPHVSIAPHGMARSVGAVGVHAAPAAHAGVRSGGQVRSAPSGVRIATRRTGTGTSSSSTRRGVEFSNSEFDSDFSQVPGLGFDFPHLAAIQGGRSVGLRHRHDRGVSGFFPILDSGFFLPTAFAPIEEAPAPAAAAPAAAEDVDAEAYAQARRSRTNTNILAVPTEPTYSASSSPQRDQEEYIFVRRDGTVFFAVAYSWESGGLRYITKDGLRRMVSRDMLDLDATRQFNEQRGLNFRVPA